MRRILLGDALVDAIDGGFGALVAFPGLLERVPLDTAVLAEAGVFRSDGGALQAGRDRAVADPALLPGERPWRAGKTPRFGSLEGRRLRIDERHQGDAQEEIQLQRKCGGDEQGQRRASRARARPAHAAPRRWRSAASTRSVGGRTPRQKKN